MFAVALAFTGGLAAQVVRDNVNMMNPAPGSFQGDIFERQVETDIAVSPVNSGRAMAGFITYQTLDAALGASSWCGYSVTNNGGKTWKSNLLPGYPQSGQTASPLWGLNQCVDPVLAAAPPSDASPAHIYYGGMGMTKGLMTKVFVSTFDDRDDQNGDLIYRNMVVVDSGNYSFQGQVLDKPAITVDPPSPGYPQGIVHFTYVVFNGTSDTDFRTKVLYVRSTDGGLTFSKPVKLNGTFNKNNGTAMARTGGSTGTVYVFWRTFLEENGIQVVSIDRSGNVSKPVTVAGGPVFFPFDQMNATTSDTWFRSSAFPTAAADASGKIYAAWQECVKDFSGSPGPCTAGIGPRIVVATSTDGKLWPGRAPADIGGDFAHQIQPDLAVGGGIVSLLYYDARNDGRPLTNGLLSEIDRRMEVRVTQALAGGPFNASAEVSQYTKYTTPDGMPSNVVTQRPGFTRTSWESCKSTQSRPYICDAVNLPNLKTTNTGSRAFIGDYIGLVPAVEYVREGAGWRLALQSGDLGARTFYAVWADNRLVSFPGSPASPNINGIWTGYVPGPSNCVNPGSRNTKPFFAAISPGVIARWSGTSHPVKDSFGNSVNAFTLSVENLTPDARLFQISLTSSDPWSLLQTIDGKISATLQVLGNSSFTRGVYYRGSGTPSAPVVVSVTDGGLLNAGVTVNPCSLLQSQSWCGAIAGNNLYDLTATTQSARPLPGRNANNAQPHSFGFENFGFENFGFENFGFENFGFENFGFENSAPADYDVSWSVTGAGVLPTAGSAFVNLTNAQSLLNSGYRFRLFAYLTHSTPSLYFGSPSGCPVAGLSRQDQVISNIPITPASSQAQQNFGFENFGFENFGFENSAPSDITNAAFVADGNGLKLTLRSFHPAGAPPYTPSSATVSQAVVPQPLNPGQTVRTAQFDDQQPPVITYSVAPYVLGAWTKDNVTVTFTCVDGMSGVLTPPLSPQVVTTDGRGQYVSASCTDKKGNTASVSAGPINIDKNPPVITPVITGTRGNNDWYTSDVTVTWTVIDAGSGVGSTSGCGLVTLTAETAGTTVTCSATDNVGNSSSKSVVIKIDKNPPQITINTPVKDSAYLLNAVVASSYTCTDLPSGVATCTGPANVPTSTLGPNSFTVDATDNAGNTTKKTVKYSVVYKFILTPPKSDANLGSAVPLIWQLTDANGTVIISDLGSLKSLTSYAPLVPGACGSGTPALLYSPAGGATGGSGFRFSGTTFQINWDTSTAVGTGPGCYTLEWTFNDNSKQRTNIVLR